MIKIVIPAFKRVRSINRLLGSLLRANINEQNVSILVSLDGGYDIGVRNVVENFIRCFSKGQLELYIQPKNIGLRNHILWCGSLSTIYTNILVLEDDLIVDKYFLSYVQEALIFYHDCKDVASISLYSPQWNEFENLPFLPHSEDGKSTYFMQIPSSWGQIWTSSQWDLFASWYDRNMNIDFNSLIQMPVAARNWPESSWKKYFYAYLLQNDKYVVYPYRSYTTNCSDPGGSHNVTGINFLHVPVFHMNLSHHDLQFSAFTKDAIKYDAYYERSNLSLPGNINNTHLTLSCDIYGSKPAHLLAKSDYVLTTRLCKDGIIAKYPLAYKPISLNLEYPGEESCCQLYLVRGSSSFKESCLAKTVRISQISQFFSYHDLSKLSVLLFLLFERICTHSKFLLPLSRLCFKK